MVPVEDKYLSSYPVEVMYEKGEMDRLCDQVVADTKLWKELRWEIYSLSAGDMLRVIMERKRISQTELALRLGIDKRVVYGFLHNSGLSKRHVVGICVALHLPECICNELLQKSQVALCNEGVDLLLKRVIERTEDWTVETVDCLLQRVGSTPLFPKKAG